MAKDSLFHLKRVLQRLNPGPRLSSVPSEADEAPQQAGQWLLFPGVAFSRRRNSRRVASADRTEAATELSAAVDSFAFAREPIFLLKKGCFVVEKACFLSEIIGFLKAGSRTSSSSVERLALGLRPCRRRGCGGAPPRRVCVEDHMQGWVQQGIKEAIEKRYLKSGSLIIIDDCAEAVERDVLSPPL